MKENTTVNRIFICIFFLIVGFIIVTVTVFLYENTVTRKNLDNNTITKQEDNDYSYPDSSDKGEITSIVKDIVIMGNVELKHNGFIYIFNGQHFGELGYEIEEYTSSNIDDKNQTCIDYLTKEKYDTSYIEVGDLLICRGDFINGNDFDTKNNPIIVLKSKDYNKMKQDAINGSRKPASKITLGHVYTDLGYMYLKYDIEDSTHSDKTYHFPFIQKAYITKNSKIKGKLEKGKAVKVQYNSSSSHADGFELKSIEVIE